MNLSGRILIRAAIVAAVAQQSFNFVHDRFIHPLEVRLSDTQAATARVYQRLESAQNEMQAIKEREMAAAELRGTLKALHENLPAEPSVVWLPPRMKASLARGGLSQATVQFRQTAPESDLPGYERSFWHVILPAQPEVDNLADGLRAVAQMEEDERFLNLQDLSFRADPEAPDGFSGFVNMSAFVPASRK